MTMDLSRESSFSTLIETSFSPELEMMVVLALGTTEAIKGDRPKVS
jgi:hypothetical protein